MARGRINARAVGLVLIALILVLFLAQPTQRYFAQRAQINALIQQVNASEERVAKAKAELERWNDAAWQQGAAARVDHAHMLRAHLYPDQIHNFAHNSEWLVRTLNHVGRVREALAIAANLVARDASAS